MKGGTLTPDTIANLRREFDEGFRTVPESSAGTPTDYLVLRAGGVRYAVILRDVASIQAQPQVTRLPGAVRGLLGICSTRGALLAVYDLAVALGQPASNHCPWLVRVTGTTLAFAFEHLECHARLERTHHHTSSPQSVNLDASTSLPLLDLQTLARNTSAEGQGRLTAASKENQSC